MSYLVKEFVPLCHLAAGDDFNSLEAEEEVFFLLEPGAEPVEQVETELEEQVEVPQCGLLSRRFLIHLACLPEPLLIVSYF